MAFLTWISLASFLALATCNMSVDIIVEPAGEIKAGQEVTVQCTVEGQIDRKATFVLERSVDLEEHDDDDDGVRTSVIADVQRVYDNFADHMTSTFSGEATKMVIDVVIKAIRGGDSGRYRCRFTQKDTPYTAEQDVEVRVPIESVEIVRITNTSTTPVEEGMGVDLDYSGGVGVGCAVKVKGTREYPQVGVNTETGVQFSPVPGKLHESVSAGQWNIERTHLYQYKQQYPSLTLHGKTITCTASLQGYPAKMASATMNVYTVPEVECNPAAPVEVGKSVTLRCAVKSSPQPDLDKTAWSWKTQKDGNRTVVLMNNIKGHYTTELQDEGNTLDYVATLVIDGVNATDFTSYRLEVVNDQGKQRGTLKLEEVVTTTTTTTVATTTTKKPSTKKQQETTVDNGKAGAGKPGSSAVEGAGAGHRAIYSWLPLVIGFLAAAVHSA